MVNTFYKVYPLGYIEKKNDKTCLMILDEYRLALKDLEKFSHAIILWWISQNDNEQARANRQDAPPNDCPITGIFASRSPNRPNPIGLTVANILNVDHKKGEVEIRRIDAFDKTPIIDIKGYFPSSDRIRSPVIPEWYDHLPEWFPEVEEEKLSIINPKNDLFNCFNSFSKINFGDYFSMNT